MVVHYFILRALCQELDNILRNAVILDVFSQQKNELCIILSVGDEELSLCISVESGLNYCVLRDGFNRAKKNSIDLFQRCIGKSVVGCSIHPNDRTIILKMEDNSTFCFQLYNTAASNIFLLDSENIVLESFKREKEYVGKKFEQSSGTNFTFSISEGEFYRLASEQRDRSFLDFLKALSSVLGLLYTREIIHTLGVDEKVLLKDIPEDILKKVYGVIVHVVDQCNTPRPTLYSIDGEPKNIAVFPLEHCKEMEAQSYDTMNEAVAAFLNKKFRKKNFADKKKELLAKVRRSLEQSERTVKAIRKELDSGERAEEYEHIGHTLMANLHEIKKGMKQIVLLDVYDDSKQLSIQLDPAFTPHQNAERYFDKARKARGAREDAKKRIVTEEQELESLKTLFEKLETCETLDALKLLVKSDETMVDVEDESDEDRLPFRVFTVAGGYEVWVGKSSANNDLLTMKYAKPNDLWFHARGVGGSHTVLKSKNGKTPPLHEAILQAAQIAAYYSKMRNGVNVPVSYCERKYVRKPKHVQEGSVVLEREEVLFVKPLLP